MLCCPSVARVAFGDVLPFYVAIILRIKSTCIRVPRMYKAAIQYAYSSQCTVRAMADNKNCELRRASPLFLLYSTVLTLYSNFHLLLGYCIVSAAVSFSTESHSMAWPLRTLPPSFLPTCTVVLCNSTIYVPYYNTVHAL